MAGRGLSPTIGVVQGTALYLGAVLGAGVLILPGAAATIAGPASVVSWTLLSLLGLPLALAFAALAARYPDAGGVASFAARALTSTISEPSRKRARSRSWMVESTKIEAPYVGGGS
jgi:amino acid efflux transporter